MHNNGILLRPVLSIPGSSYYNLNNFLTQLFDKVPGANIETSTLDARRKLGSIKLCPGESIVSLDVKSLYTNVPVNEAIEIALRSLYSSAHAPEILRSTLKTILKLAVTNVCLKFNDRWFCQMDSLAMGVLLAVTLNDIWMKSFEHQIKSTKRSSIRSLKMNLTPVLIATVESPIQKMEWNVRNVRIGSIQNAKMLMINFMQK